MIFHYLRVTNDRDHLACWVSSDRCTTLLLERVHFRVIHPPHLRQQRSTTASNRHSQSSYSFDHCLIHQSLRSDYSVNPHSRRATLVAAACDRINRSRRAHTEVVNQVCGRTVSLDRDTRYGSNKDREDSGQKVGDTESNITDTEVGLLCTDSWIDISSQPSSSLMPLGRDESVSTGLQVTPQDGHRSRQLDNRLSANDLAPRSTSVAGSSQDEYDESESDSDRVLSSLTEDVSTGSNEEREEDDNATALGVNYNIFTPQPNVFSHPPHPRSVSASNPDPHTESYFPAQRPQMHTRLPSNRVPTIRRPTVTSRVSHSGPMPDHDAALRASLTTLLSCANAVRKDKEPLRMPSERPSPQPVTLQLVPESRLNTRSRRPSSSSRDSKVAAKRKSRESSKERTTKKVKAKQIVSEEVVVSPTMISWCISAGIVLVFSAISFSAGYALGKDVGHVEAQTGLACGRDAMRGSRTGLRMRLASAIAAA